MDKYLQFGKYTANCPEWLMTKIQKANQKKIDQFFVTQVLKSIREEFDPRVHEVSRTNDFKTSRFITVKEILSKRQYSCGSLATVVAAALRNLGIPTKLIDGGFIKNNPQMRHAWNEVLVNGVWQSFDIMQRDFGLTEFHVKRGEYVDWAELEEN